MKQLIDFLEENLSNYYQSNDVCRLDVLSRFLGEELPHEDLVSEQLQSASMNEVFEEFVELQDKLFNQALENYTKNLKQ